MNSASSLTVTPVISPSLAQVTDWLDTFDQNTLPTFFQTKDWILPWFEIASHRVKIWVFLVKDGDKLVGLSFAGQNDIQKAGITLFKRLFFFETGLQDIDVLTQEYSQPVASPDNRDKVVKALSAWMKSTQAESVDEFILNRMMTKDHAVFSEDKFFNESIFRHDSGFAIDLNEARQKGAVLDLLSSNTRSQIKRAIKKYQQRGDIVVEQATSIPQALEWFKAMGELHQKYWTGKGERGAYQSDTMLAVHQSILQKSPLNEAVEMVKIRAGDHIIGYLYNFLHKGRIYYYLAGFEYEQDPHLKPGMVCHVVCAEEHIKAGRAIYDFMGGSYQYKASLGKVIDPMIGLSLRRKNIKWALMNTLKNIKDLIQKK